MDCVEDLHRAGISRYDITTGRQCVSLQEIAGERSQWKELVAAIPYLTLPYGEGHLLPSAEASGGPKAHPRINLKVTETSWSFSKLQECELVAASTAETSLVMTT